MHLRARSVLYDPRPHAQYAHKLQGWIGGGGGWGGMADRAVVCRLDTRARVLRPSSPRSCF